ncbi:MAG: neutral/alkaline non-lysosomal ceramidase N-terminal domain-containing protein [Bacteroidetes bacterium]|nr:neutral/alkaline non-lysosomal ceramidase N-terminal domain-containing protein [Bacteroidota bacterium]
MNQYFKLPKLLITSFLAIAGLVFISSCNNKKSGNEIMIGLAEVNYKPDVGLDLVGNYRGDDYASRGIHDSLYAKALVAKDKRGEKVAILSIDICMLPKESIYFLREIITSGSDIKAENIMIMATHTHSGPKPDLNNPKAKEFLTRAAGAVFLANERLMPTIISAGRSRESRISHNRRLKAKDGTTHMCWEKLEPGYIIEPWGLIDPEVITLTFEQEGRETGVLVNFGCHATTLTGNNWLYSADYPGYLAESVKRVKGKDFVSMFCNGCCGNVTQVDYRIGFPDTFQECQRIGYMLGVSAMEAMENSVQLQGDIVTASREMVALDRINISDERIEWAKKLMKIVEKEGMPPIQADGMPDAYYAKSWIEMREKQDIIDSAEVMVIRIGDLAFVGLPGEIFNEFGIEIKAKSPCRNTIVTGNTNDKRSYFPTKVSFTQGPEGFTPYITGYETTPGSTLYEIGSGEKLAKSAINQLKKIF